MGKTSKQIIKWEFGKNGGNNFSPEGGILLKVKLHTWLSDPFWPAADILFILFAHGS